MDQLFSSLPVPGLMGDNYTGHEQVAKSDGMIQILCFVECFFSRCRGLLGVSHHPQVTRQSGSYPVQMPKTRQVEFREVNRSGECNVYMPANFAIVTGEKKRKGNEAMCDRVGQGVRNLFGYRFHPICEYPEAAKIAASNLPLIDRV